MSQNSKAHDQLSPLKRAYLALEKAHSRLETLERARHEGIAVVGMACRFPGGVNSPEDYWGLLAEGGDAIVEVPASRWDVDAYFDPDPNAPGKVCSRFGGFLDNMDRFDAAFFGISPREAESLDPQQRLLLEVAQEAFEGGGVAGDQLLGSSTGVFVGLANGDYYCLLTGHCRERIDAYMGTGTSPNSAAGRVSYVFGLRGPCVAIDTACSSSLVAIHLACQSLRYGECQMALAGGVNVMLTPDMSITFSKAHMLCPDGRCKTFDADANGYVRGEGVGLLLLKRLSDALADGDHILAVLGGSAVNHAGASGGLTVPNGPAQQEVIRRALDWARLRPEDVDYIEAHGTGTPLGDPIEVGAIGAVFAGRSRPLWMGSVKTNLGHLEAAAGIAGVIKVILALQHEELPPHLHFRTPSPRIPWEHLPVRVPTRRQPWPAGPRRRVAGVSSFGFSGINAHVVVEEAPAKSPDAGPVRPCYLLPLSSKHPEALPQLAARLSQRLAQDPGLRLSDVCCTLAAGRGHFEHRLAIVARTREEAWDGLEKFSVGQPGDRIRAGHSEPETCKVAFLLAGDEARCPRLGLWLYEAEPVFRAAVDQCGAIVAPALDRPLASILGQSVPFASPLHSQVARFALQFAAVQLWQSWGIRPAILFGQGVGQLVATCLAGVLTLEQALRWIAGNSGQSAAPTCSRPHRKLILPSTGELATEPLHIEYERDTVCRGTDLSRVERTLAAEGIDTFLEVGPQGSLLDGIRACREAVGRGGPARWLRGLAANGQEWEELLRGLADLYVAGAAIDWRAVVRPWGGRKVPLPTYPFQRRRYWVETSEAPLADISAVETVHPLLGRRIYLAAAGDLVPFENQLLASRPPFLDQHRVAGLPILPASGFFEISLAAARELGPHREMTVEDLVLKQAMPFPQGVRRIVQTAVKPDAGAFRFEIHSRPIRSGGTVKQTPWTLHASGRLAVPADQNPAPWSDVEELRRRCSREVPVENFYPQLVRRGLQYGPLFQRLKQLWMGDREALGLVELAPEVVRETEDYVLYPPLVDACLHVTAELLDPRVDGATETRLAYVPVGAERIRVFAPPPPVLWSHARMSPGQPIGIAPRYEIDVDLLVPDGTVAARIEGLHVQQVDLQVLGRDIAHREAVEGETEGTAGALADEIHRLPPRLQRERLTRFLGELVSRVLKLPRHEQPPLHRNLFDLGLDSLMSVELLYRVNTALGINLSMQTLLEGAAIAPLVEVLVRELNARGPAPVLADAASVAEVPAEASRPAADVLSKRPTAAARLRLVCCGPPGSDPAVFSGRSQSLETDVELCPVRWPDEWQDPQTRQWVPLVDRLAEQILDLLDRPFAFLGYGSGGLLAWELAQTIKDRFGLSPARLFVVAACPPESVEELLASDDDEAPDYQGYTYRFRPPLDCPLTAVTGPGNDGPGREAMLGWRNRTTASFRLETLAVPLPTPTESPAELLKIVGEDLASDSR